MRSRIPALAGGTLLGLALLGGVLVGSASATPARSLPTPCVVMEALVSDEVSGPAPGNGEVVRFSSSASQATLTSNGSPAGGPSLDSPEDMAFDLNGNIVTADEGVSTGVSQVVRVDRATGVRTAVSGPGVGSGPALNGPNSIAVEPNGTVLVLDFDPVTFTRRLLQITSTGARSVLSAAGVGGGPAFGFPQRVRVLGGVIYLTSGTRVLSVDAITGNRTLVSGGTRGAGPAFAGPYSMTADATSAGIVVLDQTSGGTGALIRVDLATGDRTVLPGSVAPASGATFATPFDVVRNGCENAYYVLHSAGNGAVGDVRRIDAAGTATTYATYTAAVTAPSNYSLLMRPLVVVRVP